MTAIKRTTVEASPELLRKVKQIALNGDVSVKLIITTAIKDVVERYERKHGEITFK